MITSRGLRVLRKLPHPGRGFTQGLVVAGSTVWESSGGYGESVLLRYRLGASAPEATASLPGELFGEGICLAGDTMWQLTWRERVALRWDPQRIELIETIAYNREGWGICLAGDQVMTSDGSSELVTRDPGTLAPLRTIGVRLAGRRVTGLNDLAFAGGLVWANILAKPYLAGIDPETGEVTDVVDARPADERHWGDPQAVLNGIAPLAADGELVLTGKRWRHLYHVRLSRDLRRDLAARLLSG